MKKKLLNNRFIILFFLVFCFVIPVLSAPVITHAATGGDSENKSAFYLEGVEVYDITRTIINNTLSTYRSTLGISQADTLYFICTAHNGTSPSYHDSLKHNMWVYVSDQPFTVVSASSSTVYFKTDGQLYQQRHRTSDGGVSFSQVTSLYAITGNQVSASATGFVCSSHTISDSNGLIYCTGILSPAFSNPGFSYDSQIGIEDYTQEIEDLQQSVLDEILVTEDEEPNVFLRIFKNITSIITYIALQIVNLSKKLFEAIDAFLTNLPTILSDALSNVEDIIGEIKEFIFGIVNDFRDMLINLVMSIWIMELIDGISLNSIWGFIHDITTDILDAIENLGGITLSDLIISALPSKLQDIYHSIWAMGTNYDANGEFNILTFFENLAKFLFLPEEGYITDKIIDLSDSIAPVNALISVSNEFKSLLNNLEGVSPVITIPERTVGDIYFPGLEINFDWFEEWKPYTDAFLTAFLYFGFFFHLVKNLPSIISGTPSIPQEKDAPLETNWSNGIFKK